MRWSIRLRLTLTFMGLAIGPLLLVQHGRKQGIMIIAQDEGPGIPDIAQAMQDGYSTGNSLGLGLPGTKRLMDEFDIVSHVGRGTTVTLKKWVG